MSTNYKEYRTEDNKPILVEAARRDGDGKNIKNNYAKQNGFYGQMGVGKSTLSGNLDTKVVANNLTAYLFRTAGGSLEIGNTCKVKHLTGGSLGFNQLAKINESSSWTKVNSYTVVLPYVLNSYYHISDLFTIPAGHKIWYKVKTSGANWRMVQQGDLPYLGSETCLAGYETIKECVGSDANEICVVNQEPSETEVDTTLKINIVDLTATFGETIANYIYSLGSASAGIAWIRKYLKKEWYPYTPVGAFQHVKTKGKKYVDFNVFNKNASGVRDNEAMSNSGGTYSSPGNFVTDYIKVVPGMSYSADAEHWLSWVNWYDADKNFISQRGSSTTVPANAVYGRWTGIMSNKDTACLHFAYDGERDGEFEEYNEHTVPMDPIDLIGMPKIDAQGNLYFEGNHYNADGSIDEEYLEYTFTGQESFTTASASRYIYYGLSSVIKRVGSEQFATIWMPGMHTNTKAHVEQIPYSIAVDQDGGIYFYIGSGATVEQLKAFLTGKSLIAPKATATQGEATPFDEIQAVDNWGTEEFLDPDNDTRPCEIPVGHDTDYPVDLKSKLEIAPDLPEDDGVYVVDVESGIAQYVPLDDYLADNGYKKASELPTVEALGGTLRQLLAANQNIDFDNTAFVDLGELDWNMNPDHVSGFSVTGSQMQALGIKYGLCKMICSKYKMYNDSFAWATFDSVPDKVIAKNEANYALYVKDSSYSDVDSFKAAMKGQILAYEKASE